MSTPQKTDTNEAIVPRKRTKGQQPPAPPLVGKALAPKPGLMFTLTEAAFHHHSLRSLIGKAGLIAGVLETGLLIVQYAEGTRHCAPALGVVGPAPAPPKPEELAPRRFRVELLLPPRACSPNYRGPRATKTEWVKMYREDCAARFRERIAPLIAVKVLRFPVVLSLDFGLFGGNELDSTYFPSDEDNARGAFKPGQDALQDAGIIPRDDDKHVTVGYTHLHRGKAAHGKTMLVMTLTEPGWQEKEGE